jgi:molybdopterin synthase sulfur carrier subunit
MRISLQYFASIRDLVGVGGEEITIPPGSTVEELLETLKALHDQLMDAERILVAVNGAYVDPGAVLEGGDKIALFPPVSGG